MRRYLRNLIKMFAVCFFSYASIGVFPHEGTAQNPWESQQPVLTVTSSASEYDQFEPIVLTLTVSLEGHGTEDDHRRPTDFYVTTYEAGTIGIVSATRNGRPIQPAIGTLRFDDSPVALQIRSLRRLVGGTALTIPLDLQFAPSLGGSRLSVKLLDPAGRNSVLTYPLGERGLYVLQFVYEYTGPDHGWVHPFRGKILSNAVRFRVR
jgi:hypothetical protein